MQPEDLYVMFTNLLGLNAGYALQSKQDPRGKMKLECALIG